MKVLFIADVFGKPGRLTLAKVLPELKKEKNYDLVIANAENVAAGAGINKKIYEDLLQLGVDYFTSGNHVWDRKEVIKDFDDLVRLVRPANYPPGVPGQGWLTFDVNGKKVGLLNLVGRVFMDNYDCPFRIGEEAIEEIRKDTNLIIVDFHGEATSEKAALGWYLDGKVSAIIGTHTHVITADEKILPCGTAFITDAGLTGPMNSSIGVQVDEVLQRFLTMMPVKFEPAKGDTIFNAVEVEIEENTGRAKSISRIQRIVMEKDLK